MTTLSDAMDLPLTVLMRAAVCVGAVPELRGVQEHMVAAVQVLEGVRIGVAHLEAPAAPPRLVHLTPCAVVDLGAVRAARADGAVRP